MMKKMFVLIFMMVMCGGTQKIVCAEKLIDLEFTQLVKFETNFYDKICEFPTIHNRLGVVAGDDIVKQQRIVEHAKGVKALIHPKVASFINKVFLHKKQNGNDLEKNLYQNMSFSDFLLRLYKERPLMNYTVEEKYLLQEKDQNNKNIYGSGKGNFDRINENGRYTTQEERRLAGFLGVSSKVSFVNDGRRFNKGEAYGSDSFINEGVYAGLVGACFEQEWLAPYKFILRNKLTIEDSVMKNLWLALFGITLETDEVVQQALRIYDTSRYVEVYINREQCIFDKEIYKKYMEFVIQPFFVDGNERAKEIKKQAYLHIIGLGAGEWGVKDKQNNSTPMQEQCIIDLCLKMIEDGDYENISDLDFSWLNAGKYQIGDKNFEWEGRGSTKVFNEEITFKNGKTIRVHISLRNPADLFPEEDKEKLLVAMYAWDHGSLPGNEYWVGALTISGDPAAASSGTVPQMHTPHMNPYFEMNIKRDFGQYNEQEKFKLEDQEKIDAQKKLENQKKIEQEKLALENQQKLDEQKKLDLENQEKIDKQKGLEDQQNFDKELRGLFEGWEQEGLIQLLPENKNQENIENEKKEEEHIKKNSSEQKNLKRLDKQFKEFLDSQSKSKNDNRDAQKNGKNELRDQELNDAIELEKNKAFFNEQWQAGQNAQVILNKQINEINDAGTKKNTTIETKETKNNDTQDNRWRITKLLTYFKIGPVPVIPAGMAALFVAAVYHYFMHGIGIGMVFGH